MISYNTNNLVKYINLTYLYLNVIFVNNKNTDNIVIKSKNNNSREII